MSASHSPTHDLRRGDSLFSERTKQAGRALLQPVVRLALALRLTANRVTVIGFLIVSGAAVLIAAGNLLIGAAVLTAGSLLDAVDGALARASGGTTPFGGFLDSTLDRAAEAALYAGVAAYYLNTAGDPTWPVVLAFLALTASFLVSYTRARAEGIGLSASVGLAPRVERLVLIIAGIALAGLGLEIGLIGALGVIAVLSTATTIQRIWHVRRLTAAQPPAADGNDKGE
ncbi:MAG TPA: CDP-alcohol phosphatidyltransferase family protein [candidate division Zixibacteria bacterium]|nr:CDP-alcohol phosphatidyltransferase family protein [candidate division Zixibacteria bacterium]